jgi:dolichol-phosphate mannosyltransferase
MLRGIWPAGEARDYTSGYRAFSRKIIKALLSRYGGALIEEKGFAATLELLLKASRLTSAIGEVPLELHYERKMSVSKMRILKTIREYALLLARLRFDKRPL